MSAASRPVGGRDSGEFSTLMASAGRLGTAPPGAGWPVRGQAGEAAGADAAGLLAVVLCEHPAITRAVAPATAAKRMPRARTDLLFMGTFPSGWTSVAPETSVAPAHRPPGTRPAATEGQPSGSGDPGSLPTEAECSNVGIYHRTHAKRCGWEADPGRRRRAQHRLVAEAVSGQRGVLRCLGRRWGEGVGRGRPAGPGARDPRPHASRRRRPRDLPPPAVPQPGTRHHADRPRLRDRPDRRSRAWVRRLHHQTLQPTGAG